MGVKMKGAMTNLKITGLGKRAYIQIKIANTILLSTQKGQPFNSGFMQTHTSIVGIVPYSCGITKEKEKLLFPPACSFLAGNNCYPDSSFTYVTLKQYTEFRV